MDVMLTTTERVKVTVDGRKRALTRACNVKKGKHGLGNLKADLPEPARLDGCRGADEVGREREGRGRAKGLAPQYGLRKRTAHELAKAGASVYEIAARLSQSDFKTSAPYVVNVDRARLARSGFDLVQRAREAPSVPRNQLRGTLSDENAYKTDAYG